MFGEFYRLFKLMLDEFSALEITVINNWNINLLLSSNSISNGIKAPSRIREHIETLFGLCITTLGESQSGTITSDLSDPLSIFWFISKISPLVPRSINTYLPTHVMEDSNIHYICHLVANVNWLELSAPKNPKHLHNILPQWHSIGGLTLSASCCRRQAAARLDVRDAWPTWWVFFFFSAGFGCFLFQSPLFTHLKPLSIWRLLCDVTFWSIKILN